MLQAADAIAEAHSLGIVHRDIKPANLFLIRRPNGTPCVKVLDFGISKQITPDKVDLTKTGSMLGSPLYMSPEQMARKKEVDARSDIWAMGVVLYELSSGRLPFPAETLPEVIALVLQEEPVPLSQARPGLPLELDRIIMRCLQKRPEHRFQRMEELTAALGALLGAPSGLAGLGAGPRPSFASHLGLTPVSGPVSPARASQPSHPSQPGLVPPGIAPQPPYAASAELVSSPGFAAQAPVQPSVASTRIASSSSKTSRPRCVSDVGRQASLRRSPSTSVG